MVERRRQSETENVVRLIAENGKIRLLSHCRSITTPLQHQIAVN